MMVSFSYIEKKFRSAKPGEESPLTGLIFQELKDYVATGDFPKIEGDIASFITFTAHQHLSSSGIDYIIAAARQFYRR